MDKLSHYKKGILKMSTTSDNPKVADWLKECGEWLGTLPNLLEAEEFLRTMEETQFPLTMEDATEYLTQTDEVKAQLRSVNSRYREAIRISSIIELEKLKPEINEIRMDAADLYTTIDREYRNAKTFRDGVYLEKKALEIHEEEGVSIETSRKRIKTSDAYLLMGKIVEHMMVIRESMDELLSTVKEIHSDILQSTGVLRDSIPNR